MTGTIAPDRDDHRHALRVLVGLLVPACVLVIVGRPELLVYAVFGSFAGMYGRRVAGRQRIVRQVQAAGLLTVGVAIGVTLSALGAPVWVLVVVETAYALVGSLAADIARLRPAGPFFFIFALGATAMVPTDLVAPAVAVSICAVTAALAVVIGMIGTPHPLAGPPWLTGMRWLLRTPPSGVRVHAVRYAVAVGSAGAVGTVLGVAHANWAMAAAAVPLAAIDGTRPGEASARAVLVRAGHRTLGTFVGLLIAALLLAVHPGPSVIAMVAVILLWPTELFMGRHYAVAIGFFTPLIMLMTELAAPAPPLEMLVLRGVDTLIGVAAGVAVALVAPKGRGRRRS